MTARKTATRGNDAALGSGEPNSPSTEPALRAETLRAPDADARELARLMLAIAEAWGDKAPSAVMDALVKRAVPVAEKVLAEGKA